MVTQSKLPSGSLVIEFRNKKIVGDHAVLDKYSFIKHEFKVPIVLVFSNKRPAVSYS
jgi:hypothetical protein